MLSPWHGFPMAQMRPHNGMQTTSHFHTWCNHSNKRPHQIEKRFERVTGEMFTLLQHRFWLQLDNVSRISISCNSCIRHCHHISKCFLFEWIKVCATALQEWWCLRWLDIDSGPQCGIPTYPSPASYWYIVILALSNFSLICFPIFPDFTLQQSWYF